MNFLENTIEDFIAVYGNTEEKEVYELYRGDFKEVFGGTEIDLQEASGFAGMDAVLFSVLTFILESVESTSIQDTVERGKKIILNRLRKNKIAIVEKAPKESIELTCEIIDKLIVLLRRQLESLPPTDA